MTWRLLLALAAATQAGSQQPFLTDDADTTAVRRF